MTTDPPEAVPTSPPVAVGPLADGARAVAEALGADFWRAAVHSWITNDGAAEHAFDMIHLVQPAAARAECIRIIEEGEEWQRSWAALLLMR